MSTCGYSTLGVMRTVAWRPRKHSDPELAGAPRDPTLTPAPTAGLPPMHTPRANDHTLCICFTCPPFARRDGRLNFEDFISATLDWRASLNRQILAEVFQLLDQQVK